MIARQRWSIISLAPVAELVDATDSKSVVHWTCPFESDRGHHSLFKTLRIDRMSFVFRSIQTVFIACFISNTTNSILTIYLNSLIIGNHRSLPSVYFCQHGSISNDMVVKTIFMTRICSQWFQNENLPASFWLECSE